MQRSIHPISFACVRRLCVCVAVVFSWGGGLRAQGLTYVDHVSMDLHDTMLSTNISLELWDSFQLFTAVPKPSTWGLMMLGLGVVVWGVRRRIFRVPERRFR